MPESVAKVIHELRGKLRALCTLLRAAEILEALGHTDLAAEILDIMEGPLWDIPALPPGHPSRGIAQKEVTQRD